MKLLYTLIILLFVGCAPGFIGYLIFYMEEWMEIFIDVFFSFFWFTYPYRHNLLIFLVLLTIIPLIMEVLERFFNINVSGMLDGAPILQNLLQLYRWIWRVLFITLGTLVSLYLAYLTFIYLAHSFTSNQPYFSNPPY